MQTHYPAVGKFSSVACVNKHSCQGKATWTYGNIIQQYSCTESQKAEAESVEKPPEEIQPLDQQEWSEWAEVCNPRKSCPNGLHCVSFLYSDTDNILNASMTGYGCLEQDDFANCWDEDVE